MICKNCGIEITSEKIWKIHQKECEIEHEVIYTQEELEGMIFNDLLKIAKKKGINSHRMKQNELISAILEMEE